MRNYGRDICARAPIFHDPKKFTIRSVRVKLAIRETAWRIRLRPLNWLGRKTKKRVAVSEPAIIPNGYSGARAGSAPFAFNTSQTTRQALLPTTYFVKTYSPGACNIW